MLLGEKRACEREGREVTADREITKRTMIALSLISAAMIVATFSSFAKADGPTLYTQKEGLLSTSRDLYSRYQYRSQAVAVKVQSALLSIARRKSVALISTNTELRDLSL